MENRNQPQKRRSFISDSFKFLLAAASIAGTVGLWGVLSRKDAQTTATITTDSALPTVVTLIPVNLTRATAVTASNTNVSPLPVVTQPPVNYSASNVQIIQPAPVTSTRSSHP